MAAMTNFATIRETAEQRAGGPAALKKLLPKSKSAKALKAMADDRYLSLMSLRVFSSGLKHSMVAGKWPGFEEIFFGFDPKRVAAIPDENLEALLKETRIIRHWGKIKATHHNAAAMVEISGAHGGFGAWLAA
ncbi:MAG: DNA-3-methyladenine glycosylase I [Proteobacteria bacterium]|nr:DNA-3-methyladenine glycosylase I [Pseudomonadota bacterium]MDA1354657.1 DNA-3-methyladenine glycosylase I [Pseudomonadota bacterium]